MSPNAGRIVRRRPRRLTAPERDPVTGHYRRGLRHDDKAQEAGGPAEREGRRRPRVRRAAVAGAGGVLVAAGIAAMALAAGDDDPGGATPASMTTAVATSPVTTVASPTAAAPTVTSPTIAASTTSTSTTTTSTSTSTTTTTLPGPETPAHALAGRYKVTAVVASDSLAPERAGETLPFGPLVLTVDCDSTVCTVSEPTFGTATVTGDTVEFAFGGAVPCIDATRTLEAIVALTSTEKDDLGFVEVLEGTASFTWGAAASGGGPRCPAFVEVFSILAERE